MKVWLQFGGILCGLGLGAAMMAPGVQGQNRPSTDRPLAGQQRQASPPARNDRPSGSYHPQNAPRGGNTSRQPANAGRPGAYQNRSRNGSATRNGQGNAGPNGGRRNEGQRNDRLSSQGRQQAPATPPPNVQERMRSMSPQEKSRLAENQRRFNQLPPQKQQEMRQAADQWQRLTPEQQSHIKNDVLPRWKELPSDRQRAIQQRLGVLRNMPESARNRHLDDPNFTRGMSDGDKQMLRDLSHEHVGAPDRPQQ